MNPEKSPTGAILRLALPVFVAQAALVASAVIDTAMAGRLSAVDLAAVGIAASVMITVLMSLLSVLFALPPLVAHLQGAGRHSGVGREIHQSFWIALAISLVAILLLRNPGPFLAFSDLQPAVEARVRSYLDAASWGVPATAALRIFFGLSTGIGRPRPVMVFNLAALLLKFPMNAVFMYGKLGFPVMGAAGCAVATAIDAWIVATIAWFWCVNHPDYEKFGLSSGISGPDPKAIFEFLKLGVPIGLTFVADVTAFTFMALLIARLGPVMSAAHQIAANLAVLAYMFPLSLGNAASVLVGHALGADDPVRARNVSLRAIGMGLASAFAASLSFRLFAPQIAALYTTDQKVQAVAIPLIGLVAIYHLGDALQAVSVNALRGYRKTVVPMAIYGLSLWGVGLGGGILLGLTDFLGPPRGAPGFWMAGCASIWLVALLILFYLERVGRQEKSILCYASDNPKEKE